MFNSNYENIQYKIIRPQRLCLHCGRCMPIIDGENLKSKHITPDAIRGPLSVWDEYPEECGFSGWLFYEREKQKHLVRKVKEEILAISFLDDNALVDKDTTAKQRRDELSAMIEPWIKHGSANW